MRLTLTSRPPAPQPATTRPPARPRRDGAGHPAAVPVAGGGVANIAHRGASAYAPENTLAAVRKAIARDADLVEVDVQRTRDGALVLMHDLTLERTTDAATVLPGRAPWRVADLTLAEISRLDAGSWFGPEFAGERVPTLEEALAVLGLSELGILVELKRPGLYPGVVADVAAAVRHGVRRPDGTASVGDLIVQSFDHAAVRDLKRIQPATTVGALGSPAAWRLPELGRWADQVNPHHRLVDRAYVDRVHAAGMACHVWTVNTAGAMRHALRLGVDGVITNHPDTLHHVRVGRPASGG